MLIHGRLEHSDWLIHNLAKRGIRIRGARYGWDTFLDSSPCSYHQLSLHCSSNFRCDHPSITVDFCFQMRKLFISLAPRILRPDFTWPRTPRPAISATTPPVPHPPGRTVRLAFGKSFTMHYTIFRNSTAHGSKFHLTPKLCNYRLGLWWNGRIGQALRKLLPCK